MLITKTLLQRIHDHDGAFNEARFGALRSLPGNPYEVELRRFGRAVAVKIKSTLVNKQRVTGFGAAEAPMLNDIIDWYRRDDLTCSISIRSDEISRALFDQLVA